MPVEFAGRQFFGQRSGAALQLQVQLGERERRESEDHPPDAFTFNPARWCSFSITEIHVQAQSA